MDKKGFLNYSQFASYLVGKLTKYKRSKANNVCELIFGEKFSEKDKV